MKKTITILISTLFILEIVTGCKNNKKETNNTVVEETNKNQTVVEDQIYEGLEFVNVGASDGVIKTIVINNTGLVYEGSKFSMKIMDAEGNVLKEIIDEVKQKMENGTTQTIETKTDIDLTKAVSIEYSIVKK